MLIGVSKSAPNYGIWLKRIHNGLEIEDLYTLPLAEALKLTSSVSGIMLTGGGDIHPALYGCSEDIPYCKGVDEKRDELETAIIKQAIQNKIPLLGICRGQQMLNVAGSGSLYANIPAIKELTIVHAGPEDVYHRIIIREDSLLFKLTGLLSGTVNSAHHQVINVLAPGFRSSAHSPDGLIEAIEMNGFMNHPFCLAVQWHPERMELENPLSGLLGKAFLEEAGKSR